MSFSRLLKAALVWPALCVLLAVAGCGGGGGASGSSTFIPNTNSGGGNTVTTPVAADLTLVLSAPALVNTGSNTVTATATAVDANRNTVSGIPITLRVDSEASVQVSGTSSSANGTVTGVVSIGANRKNRMITVTAISGTLERTSVIQVTGTKVTATALPAVVLPGSSGKIVYSVVDATGNAMANEGLIISGPSGVQSEGKTNASGQFEYSYTAPANSGNLDVKATTAGVEAITTVIVQAGPGAVPAVPANSVRSSSVSANPSVVVANSTGDTNRIEVRALFVGDLNKPIKNIRVRFDLDGDVNSIGGAFTSGGLQVLSNDNGIALSSYIPGSRFSPTDGVTVRACWDYNDFPAGTCPSGAGSPKAKVTVVSDALSVTIGTDNKLIIGDLTYAQRYIVQVNDSSGLAKADALVNPLLDLPAYFKGEWTKPNADDPWVQELRASCDNEDLNRNGVLEIYSNLNQEDANGNGQLDPRKADAVVSVEGSARTNSAGQLFLKITWPQNVGSWVSYRLTVAATGIAGTEGRASFAGLLGVPVEDTKKEGAPAFVNSPYGNGSGDPLTAIRSPEDSTKTASVCTNSR